MHTLTSLWLPILLSAVAVFLVSSIIHMKSPWHRSDYPRLANEDEVADALRAARIPPGDYMIPRPHTRAEMSSPEFLAKQQRGPVLTMSTIDPASFSMPRNLIQWFLYLLVVTFVAAHVTQGSGAGIDRRFVFHSMALITFLGYAAALWQMSIWFYRGWSITLKVTFDGLIYALITAGIFCWLWK